MYPHLVLLPGLDGTGILFRPLLEMIDPRVPTVVVSYPVDQTLSYKELVPHVMKVLPTSSPFVLLAESFSGPLAIMIAALRPPGLSGVVLSASFCRSPHPYVPSFFASFIPTQIFRLYPPFSRIKAILGGYSSPTFRALMSEALSSVSPKVFIHRLREVLKVNVSSELASCAVPVLYLRGRRDLVVPAWNCAAVKRLLPSTIVRDIPASHMVLQTQPRLSANEVMEFLGLFNS